MIDEHIAYHALAVALQSDYAQLRKIHEQFPSWSDAWHALGSSYPQVDATNVWSDIARYNLRLILASDLDFPASLREIPSPPFALYICGTLPKDTLHIGIVGTRRATAQGRDIAKQFSSVLARAGATVVSGLALGIDGAAHLGALEYGMTIAVLASGLHMIYPTQHTQLGKRIAEHGALISEYPPGSPALPFRFLERNRIVSGLSRGVLLVEAPEQSGALATARFALDQNRDVFVIPGSITHPNYVGSLNLLKSGAIPVTTPADILNEYGVAPIALEATSTATLTPDEQAICLAIKNNSSPITIDKIIAVTTLKPHIAQQTLTYLIMNNVVNEHDGMYELVVQHHHP